MEVQFKNIKCKVIFSNYVHGNSIAIRLVNAMPIEEDGYVMGPETEPIAIATLNMPQIKLAYNEVIIKDYSENIGILNVLVNAGIVSEPLRTIKTGFVNCPVCKILKTQ